MASIVIPKTEFTFTYARGSGPGGQNVNKVNSKAILRWSVTTSPSLPDDVRERFVERYGSRLTGEGELVVTSHVYRDQPRNTADCIRRVQEMVDSVAEPPKVREATEPTAASKVRRIEDKKRDSRKKQERRISRCDW
jgi:ribosome-associated protein